MTYGKNISAVILAGGLSSRMGTDKGFVLFKGRPMITYILNVLQQLEFEEILIITKNMAYKQFGYHCFPDVVQSKGPLGGIYAGLSHSTMSKSLVLACDMPFISKGLIMDLIHESAEEDVLLTHHNGLPEPLCSIYSERCAEFFKQRLDNDQLKVTDAMADLLTRSISFDDQPWFKGNEFSNLNSPEELNKLQQ